MEQPLKRQKMSAELGNHVECGEYDIVVGSGTFDQFGTDIAPRLNASSYFVVHDSNVGKLYGERLIKSLRAAVGPDITGRPSLINVYTVEPGEDSKCRTVKANIEDWMLSKGADRSSAIVALGGGVVGDLAGFVAATYMRGIKFVQVPTTLLAMVDSSIGGKTGIDVPAGKNLVGAFHNPVRVYVDVTLLNTLPQRELCNGMAEVIKAGAIFNSSLFKELEDAVEKILAKDAEALLSAITQSIAVKVEVVLQDHKEKGLRAILNFGHSIGHGIEALTAPGMLHGECVSIGMIKETELSRSYGKLAPDALGRLTACLLAYKLPVHLPDGVSPTNILIKMGSDKKNCGGKKYIVLLNSIGDAGGGALPVEDIDVMRCLAPGAEIVPKGQVTGTITVPGSKSISNRVLLMAAMGRGKCAIRGLLHSHDTLVMMNALQQLGVPDFEWLENGKVIVVTGVDGKFKNMNPDSEVFLGNAGTASRFLTTACVLVPDGTTTLTGNARMKERPIGHLVDCLRSSGCKIDYLESEGCLPLTIAGGGFPGNEVKLAANVSSQYVSSVLISAVCAASPTTLRLTDVAVSKPYITMTTSTMLSFGVTVENPEEGVYIIPNKGFDNPKEFVVESDASSASYPLALAAITGGTITVDGIGSGSLQGDAAFCRVLEQMGCKVEQTTMSTTVTGPPIGQLKAIDVDMSNVTDTFMTAAVVMATVTSGTSRITNIANQRVKECDRIAAMATELAKCGVVAREQPDGIEIDGQASIPSQLVNGFADIFCYKDHRIAMSFGVLGSVWPNIHIMDKDCTDKTFPSFWNDLKLVFDIDTKPWNPVTADDSAMTSVVIVGMRGAGKTTFAKEAASVLTSNWIDVDDEIANAVGTIDVFVKKHGWPAFRDQETQALNRCLDKLKQGGKPWVVSCGGGIVESETNRNMLKACGVPVVWLQRDIDEIERFLTADGSRPSLGEPIKVTYARRELLYASCSTHEFLPKAAELPQALAEFSKFVSGVAGKTPLDLITPKKYYLFGSPISKSPSPFMQNTAFALCSAPHEYGLCETENIEDVVACLRTSDTGGGSLTMPHKETIMPYIHELTEAATAIGAVNTVTIDATNRFIGDNTDWLGVQNALLEVLTTWSNPRVIVLGAGGTARAVLFAMRRMGCSWLGVYNRTPERAALLAEQNGCALVTDLTQVTADIIISTIAASAAFTVPAPMLDSKPTVFDVCYIPKWTPLLTQAKSRDCRTIHGLDMLIHQGVEQAILWNKMAVSFADVADAVRNKYDPEYAAAKAKENIAMNLQKGSKSKAGDILEIITQQRIRDVAADELVTPLDQLKAQLASSPPPPPICFVKRLQSAYPTCVLGEVKRASPSKGDIALDINAAEQAVKYAHGGAAAISILTEPTWFKGTKEDMLAASKALLAVENRPAVLRKDFIIDPYQVYESRLYGADALLLIVAILTDDQLRTLLALTRELGMEALVEVVTAEELSRALAVGATVIGVNNRNLRDFTVDNTKTRRVLTEGGVVGPAARQHGGEQKVLLALSGISSRLDVQGYRSSGVHGVLVGEALMRAANPTEMIFRLRGVASDQVQVKVCGLVDTAMATLAARGGVDMIGLVFAPKSSRLVSIEQAKAMIENVKQLFPIEKDFVRDELSSPPPTTSSTTARDWYTAWATKLRSASASRPLFFGVFANQSVDEVNTIARAANLDIIQLSGKEGMSGFDKYCRPVVKAVHVGDSSNFEEMVAHIESGRPAGVLLDTMSKDMMGGTGKTFDWDVAAKLAERFPLYLAGGLSPDNIAAAVTQVQPFGVDVSSGVEESAGVKSTTKVIAFIQQAKSVTTRK
eukprot:m.64838 g.64838  ORF g.64838 m.64838 type:complete len:1825 (-) comp23482_c0_seq2:292-5766(-)